MSETGNVSSDSLEEALTDHHLCEVAEMIERAHADEASSERSFSDGSGGCLRGS